MGLRPILQEAVPGTYVDVTEITPIKLSTFNKHVCITLPNCDILSEIHLLVGLFNDTLMLLVCRWIFWHHLSLPFQVSIHKHK